MGKAIALTLEGSIVQKDREEAVMNLRKIILAVKANAKNTLKLPWEFQPMNNNIEITLFLHIRWYNYYRKH